MKPSKTFFAVLVLVCIPAVYAEGKLKPSKTFFAVLVLVCIPAVYAEGLYHCTDSNGQVTVSNTKIHSKCRDLLAEAAQSEAERKKERKKLIGKTAAELKKIVREPDRIVESVTASGTVEKWMYKYQTIILINGKVTEVISVE